AEAPPLDTRAHVLLELGSAELRLGMPAAIEHLGEATRLGREPLLLTEAVRRLALAHWMSGQFDRAVEEIALVLEAVGSKNRELGLILTSELASHAQFASLEARESTTQRLASHAALQGRTPGERLVLAGLAFEEARASGTASDATRNIEPALAGGRLLAEQELDVAGPFYFLFIGLISTDAFELGLACVDQALADAKARGSIPALAFITGYRGRFSLLCGRVAQAEADARTGLELMTSHGLWVGRLPCLALLIAALIEGGELDEAEDVLVENGLDEEIPPGLVTNYLLEVRGALRLAQGKPRKGLDDLVAFGRDDELWGAASPLASRWRSRAALALAAMGEGRRAREMALEDLERGRRRGAASGFGFALRCSALVGADDAPVERLREAVRTLEDSPAQLEYARALTDLGAALRRSKKRAEARGPLKEALELAERLGGRAVAERARTELVTAGGRSSDPFGTGVERLTASERRVGELAARGFTNPEIAQALFVSRKTVETHLGHAYRKLDISGRAELAAALARR